MRVTKNLFLVVFVCYCRRFCCKLLMQLLSWGIVRGKEHRVSLGPGKLTHSSPEWAPVAAAFFLPISLAALWLFAFGREAKKQIAYFLMHLPFPFLAFLRQFPLGPSLVSHELWSPFPFPFSFPFSSSFGWPSRSVKQFSALFSWTSWPAPPPAAFCDTCSDDVNSAESIGFSCFRLPFPAPPAGFWDGRRHALLHINSMS